MHRLPPRRHRRPRSRSQRSDVGNGHDRRRRLVRHRDVFGSRYDEIVSGLHRRGRRGEPDGCAVRTASKWKGVEFTRVSVQTGTVSQTSGLTSATAGLTAVDMTKTWIVYSYSADDGTPSGMSQKLVRGGVTSTTQVTVDRNG